MTAQKGGIEAKLHSFLNLGARCEWVVNPTLWPLYTQERTAVPTEKEAG
jgi:hypothetical protein